MHELALMQDLVSTVEGRVRDGRVTRVWLEVGQLTCVAPDALRFCFEVCSEGTRLHGAELEIERIPGRAACRACGAQIELEALYSPCPCGSFELDVSAGEELALSQVEVI